MFLKKITKFIQFFTLKMELYDLKRGRYTFAKKMLILFFIVATVLNMNRFFILNLTSKINDKFSIYFNVGSFLLVKEGFFSQYIARKGGYTTDYLFSLYEPQFMIDNNIFTVYRPKPEQIKVLGKRYYAYYSESRLYLAKNKEDIPVYDNSMIAGNSISLFGVGNSVYFYKWAEILDTLFNNRINITVDCNDNTISNCNQDKFDNLNIKAEPTGGQDEFLLTLSYDFGNYYKDDDKRPVMAFVNPQDFFVCDQSIYDSYCIDPDYPMRTPKDDFPVEIRNENGEIEREVTFKDLGFNDFWVNNFKVDDFYKIYPQEPVPVKLDSNQGAYLVHKDNVAGIKITPTEGQYKADIQRQFKTLRFFGPPCNTEICQIQFKIKLYDPNKPLK